MRVTERYNHPEPVNLGTGEEITIRDLATIIAELTGFQDEIRWDPTKPGGPPRWALNTLLANSDFKFTSSIRLRDGLSATIERYERAAERPPVLHQIGERFLGRHRQ